MVCEINLIHVSGAGYSSRSESKWRAKLPSRTQVIARCLAEQSNVGQLAKGVRIYIVESAGEDTPGIHIRVWKPSRSPYQCESLLALEFPWGAFSASKSERAAVAHGRAS